MLADNERYNDFVARLGEYGVDVRRVWHVKKNRNHTPNDLHFVTFHGRGFAPAILCAMVVDYGPKHGFGLFTDESRDLSDDVRAVAGDGGQKWKQESRSEKVTIQI